MADSAAHRMRQNLLHTIMRESAAHSTERQSAAHSNERGSLLDTVTRENLLHTVMREHVLPAGCELAGTVQAKAADQAAAGEAHPRVPVQAVC